MQVHMQDQEEESPGLAGPSPRARREMVVQVSARVGQQGSLRPAHFRVVPVVVAQEYQVAH
jgi:hypothetical protein